MGPDGFFGRGLAVTLLAATGAAAIALVRDVRAALAALAVPPPIPAYNAGPCDPDAPPLMSPVVERPSVLFLGFEGASTRGAQLRGVVEGSLTQRGVDATFVGALAWDTRFRDVRCAVQLALADEASRPSLLVVHAGHGDTREAFRGVVPEGVFGGVIAARWWLDPFAIQPDLPDLGYAAFAERARAALVRAAVAAGMVPLAAEAFRPHDEALLRRVAGETAEIQRLAEDAGVRVVVVTPLWSPDAAPYGDREATQRWIASLYQDDPRAKRRRRLAIRQRDLYATASQVRPAVREHLQNLAEPMFSIDLDDVVRPMPDTWFADPLRLSRLGAREVGEHLVDHMLQNDDVNAILRPLYVEFGDQPVAPNSGGPGGP